MSTLYKNLPIFIDPVAFSIGSFSIRWYALMYIVGFLVVYGLLSYRIREKEFATIDSRFSKEVLIDAILFAFFGIIIGGRLGYVLFYDFSYYLQNPVAIFSPFNESGKYIGIYGMSYFGALICVAGSVYIFTKVKKINFWDLADFMVPAIPAGYFFGRIGNFINGELYGRATDVPWGMYFPNDSGYILRHPSQLYEAFLEGLILFLLLWFFRNKRRFSGQITIWYLSGYALTRFFCELFRYEESSTDFFVVTLNLGQMLSLCLMAICVVLYRKLSYKKRLGQEKGHL